LFDAKQNKRAILASVPFHALKRKHSDSRQQKQAVSERKQQRKQMTGKLQPKRRSCVVANGQARNEGSKGGTIPRADYCGGGRKTPTMSQVL